MRVLLINPPSKAPNPVLPLGLAYLGAGLEKAGINAGVIDAWAEGYSFEKLGARIARQNYDAIGITVISPLYAAGMKTVDIARENSEAKIVVGGAHPSALPQETLEANKNIDFAVIGEGEKTFVSLAQSLEKGNSEFESIKGLAYRKNGRLINTGPAERIENIDDLPYPAWHLFPLGRYKTHPPYGNKIPYMTVITSRGCPFSCTYCSRSVFGNKYAAMSPEKICQQLTYMITKYNVGEIHFYDDAFTIDMKRAEAICDEIVRKKIKISWSCTTRVDLVNESLLKKMKDSGCWLISYGVESANPAVLENVKKRYSLRQVEEAFRLTKKLGIRRLAYFMLGLPTETKNTIKETINFSLKLNPDFVSWALTALYPGSPLYEAAKKDRTGAINLRYADEDNYGHASGSPYGDGSAAIYHQGLPREELEQYLKEATRLFYFRLPYLICFIFKIRSFHQFFRYLREGLKTLFWISKTRIIKKIASGR